MADTNQVAFNGGAAEPVFDNDEIRKAAGYEMRPAGADEFREDEPVAEDEGLEDEPKPTRRVEANQAANDETFVRRLLRVLRLAA